MDADCELFAGYFLDNSEKTRCHNNDGCRSYCSYGFLCKKLLKTKVIFINSAADVTHASKTPVWIEKYADLFLVQWEDMKQIFPNAIHIGVL